MNERIAHGFWRRLTPLLLSSKQSGEIPMASESISLDQALLDEFKQFHKNIRTNTIAMAERAYDVAQEFADGPIDGAR